MLANLDICTIQQIINKLYLIQNIQHKVLEPISSELTSQSSCLLGLINIMYNIARQYNQKSIAESDGTVMINQNANNQRQIKKFNTLSIRGDVLRQFVRLLERVLPEPAYSLARFDFNKFNEYCVNRGLSQLLRHTRGIYPLIDTKKTPALPFLPFYQQIINEQLVLVGNTNWKIARKTVDMFYQQQVKTNKMHGNQNIQSQEKQAEIQQKMTEQAVMIDQMQVGTQEHFQRAGIKLCYIMLLQKKAEMQKFIDIFTYQYAENIGSKNEQLAEESNKNAQLVKNWKFWYQNYSKLVQEGLKMYEQRKMSINYPVVYGQQNGIWNFIIVIIQQIVQICISSEPGRISAIKNEIQTNINILAQKIATGMLTQTLNLQSKKYQSSYKMLILSYLHITYKCILSDRVHQNDRIQQLYCQLTTDYNAQSQPYNRVFYNDTKLLTLYEHKKMRQFPVNYYYGDDLTCKIFKLVCRSNESALVKNLDKIKIIKHSQRINLIFKSKLLGDVTVTNKQTNKSQGQILLDYLDSQKQQLSKHLYSRIYKKYSSVDSLKSINNFINQWRAYHKFAHNFTFAQFQKILAQWKNLNKNKIKSLQMQQNQNLNNNKDDQPQQDCIIVQDLVQPLEQPEILAKIIELFVQSMLKIKDNLMKSMLQMNKPQLQQINKLNKQLGLQLSLFTNEQFLAMLDKAIPDISITVQNKDKIKQQFQDQIWKAYSECVLIHSDYCKSVIQKQQKPRQLQHQTNNETDRKVQSYNAKLNN